MAWNWTIVAAVVSGLAYVIYIIALFVVPVNRKPSSATAWLMLIFLVPYGGAILFLILGSPKLSRHRRARQRTMDDYIKKAVAEAKKQPELQSLFDPPIPARYEPFVTLNANLGDMPAFAGNRVELLPDYDKAVDRIIAAIDGARHYVHVEYFIFADDETGGPVIDALIRACQRGVKCRVLIDHLGDIRFIRPVVKRLRAANMRCMRCCRCACSTTSGRGLICATTARS